MDSGAQGDSGSRGQSQTIGVVLLVAVAIIIVALLSVFVLDFSDDQSDETVILAVGSDMDGRTLTIRHAGGDVVQANTVTVLVNGNGTRRYDLVDFNGLGTGDRFGAGDRASRPLDTNSTRLADGFRVTVVHDPTNAELHTAVYDGLDTAALNITSTTFPSAVTAGDTATVDYTVENTGEIDGTGPVALVHQNGTTVDTDTVSLTPGETTAGTLSYTTNADDAPAVDLTVETGDDTEAATVTVDAPAFALTGSTFPGEVDAGNDSTVEFTVNNTGTASGSTTVALRRNGTTVDTTAVSLTPGENTTETLSYTTAPADAPAIALTVDTGDDTAGETVTVNPPAPNLTLTSTTFPDEVDVGNDSVVVFTVENTGSAANTTSVVLRRNGTTVDSTAVSLTPGENVSKTLSYTTSDADAPAIRLTVDTGDDTAEANVTVNETAAVFTLTNTTFPAEVEPGDDIQVDYTVNNTGNATGSTVVDLVHENGTTVDSESVSLSPGENSSGTVTYGALLTDRPSVTLTVDTGDDSVTDTVVLVEPEFTLTNTTFPDGADAGEDIPVDYTVNNTGGADGTTAVDLVHENGTTLVAQSQSLAPGENASGTLTYTAVAGDAPAVNLTVDTGDDSVTEQVNVTDAGSVRTVYVGSLDDSSYAVYASNGTKRWEFDEATDKIRSAPTVVDGTLYHGSWDSNLYAVDAATGAEEWAFTDPSGKIRSSPTVVDGTVYIGSRDSTLYAVDADTGTKEWEFTQPTGEVWSSPHVEDGTVYVGNDGGTLYAVDADTGDEEWAFAEPGKIRSSPEVANGLVYVGSGDNSLYAVNRSTGTKEWEYTAGGDIGSSPNVVGGTLYVASKDGTLHAVDPETGTGEWTYTDPTNRIVSSPTVVGGTVYVGSSDTNLYAVDADTGTEEWVFTTPSYEVRSSPTVENGTVYVGSGGNKNSVVNDGRLYAVDADTGTEEWVFSAPGSWVNSSPTVVTDPESGDSIGSRVQQELLGHHDE